MAKLILLFTLCISMQITFLEAQNDKSKSLKSYKEIGDEAYYNNQLELAKVNYKKWVKADPMDYAVWYDLACVYGLLSNKKRALSALIIALERGWSDTKHVQNDDDLKIIWEEKDFKTAIENRNKILTEQKLKHSKLHHTTTNSVGSFLVVLPNNYDKTKSYPMCVILHGSGSNEFDHGKLTEKFGVDSFIYVAVRAPYPHKDVIILREKMGWTAWYPDRFDRTHELYPKMRGFYADWIAKCIDETKQHYKIKGDKVVLIGHSQGAHFAHVFSMKYPEKVAAYLAFAGYNSRSSPFLKEGYKALKENNVSVTLLHGKQDQIIKYEQSQDLNKLMKDAGVNCKLKLVDSKHTYSKEIINAVKDWLISIVDFY